MQTVVGGARDIAEDPLHGLLVLCRRSLHEPADVADGERQVRSRVDKVAKAAHNASVLCRVHLFLRTLPTQPQPLLHRSVGWVAAGETAQLHNALGVGCLAERGAGAVLVDLDPQVERERAQVAHLEGRPHLLLERLDLHLLGVGDHKIVDVDTHQ